LERLGLSDRCNLQAASNRHPFRIPPTRMLRSPKLG
jgi:hypothetical protein